MNNNIFDKYNKDITTLFNKIKKNNEFEIDLNKDKKSINEEIYNKLLKYFNQMKKIKKLEIKHLNIFDINISYIINDNINIEYRISINGLENINTLLIELKNKTIKQIIIILLKRYIKDKPEYLELIKKTKEINKKDIKQEDKNILDIEEYNIRIRLSIEEEIKNKEIEQIIKYIETSKDNNINYRYKDRLSLILEETKDYYISFDLTKTQMKTEQINKNIKLDNMIYNNELELEYFGKTENKNNNELETLKKESIKIIKYIQDSNYIISKPEENRILENYKTLFKHKDNITQIDSKNVTSLEISHLSKLSNQYAVTDKADGEHSFIFITENEVYIITQYLHIKKTGIKLNEENKKYNNSVIDGEFLYIKPNKKIKNKRGIYCFLGFDCLFYCDEDVRNEPILLKRLDKALDIINNCCCMNKTKEIINYSKENNIDKSVEFYKKELNEYFERLNKDINNYMDNNIKEPLIRLKYFLPCGYGKSSEIFKYSVIFWEQYIKKQIHPYNLDGLVYQPLLQKYTKKADLIDLKWKPEDKNSIDFYIEFLKDEKTDKPYIIFDNIDNKIDLEDDDIESTVEGDIEKTKEKINYNIVYLYVGNQTDNKTEIPELFNPKLNNPDKDLYKAYIPIDENGYCRDIEGNIIQDKTVVEFYYNKNSKNKKMCWTPIRTRYDKTENVQKYQKKYGNNKLVAYKIWNSIVYPVLFEHLIKLSNENDYINELQFLTKSMKDIENLEKNVDNAYYKENKKLKELTEPQNHFHNMIKTMLINQYVRPDFNNNKKVSVLDIGCGRGGENYKYYNAHAKFVVGLEPSYDDLHNLSDSAIRRYITLKNTKPGVPPFYFVNASFTIPLNPENQKKIIRDTTDKNLQLIKDKFNGKNKYDVLSCMFAFHYFLSDETSWKNTIDNINKTIADEGILIITTFDGEKVNKILNENNGQYTLYITKNGEKILYHDIIKKYDDKQKIFGIGNQIDVHISKFMSEGEYRPEYLVDRRFLIPELKKKCNLDLIDEGTFEEIYNGMKSYIERIGEVEQKKDMKKHWVNKMNKIYDLTKDEVVQTLKISFLNKFYVFKHHI